VIPKRKMNKRIGQWYIRVDKKGNERFPKIWLSANFFYTDGLEKLVT